MIQTEQTFLQLLKAIKTQKAFCRAYYEQVLKETGINFQNVLEKSDSRKIQNYTLQVPLAIGETSALLRGTPLNNQERELLTLLAMGSALMDDISDKSESKNNIQKVDLLHHLQNKAKKVRTWNKAFDQQFDITFKHHNYSAIQQSKIPLSLAQLREITFNKCGHAFLLSQALLSHNIGQKEKDFMFQFGALAQIGDDILDVYDDLSASHQTLVTMQSFSDSRTLLETETSVLLKMLHDLDYPKNQKNATALHCLSFIGVFYLAHEQINSNLPDQDNLNDILSHDRSKYIVDMSSFKNQRKLFKWLSSHKDIFRSSK